MTARPARRLLAALLAVLLALAAAELGTRAWLRHRGTPWSAAGARERLERLQLEVGGELGWASDTGERYDSLVLHPYYGYDSVNLARALEKLVAGMGERPPDELSILLVGGSVAALFGVGEEGGRDELERLIAADPRAGGRTARVFTVARPGFKQPQQLHAVAELLRQGAVPDVVLNLDGFNELDLAVENLRTGLPADWPSGVHWLRVSSPPPRGEELERMVDWELERRAFAEEAARAAASPLLRSALLGRAALARVVARQARVQAAAERLSAARPGERVAIDVDQAVADAVRVWSRSSALLARICAASGVRYVHALQPTLHDRGSKPLTAEEERDGVRNGWKEAVLKGYPLLRAAGLELRAEGVRFCDASDAFKDVEETLYYDPCHFKGGGNRILAARLAEAVLSGLE